MGCRRQCFNEWKENTWPEKAKKYKWRGKWFVLPDIIAIHEKETGKVLSISTLRWRISSRGSVHKALNLKPRPCALAAIILCPDGVKRTHRGIAKHLGCTYRAWTSRFHSRGRKINEAFYYEPQVGKVKIKRKQTKKVKTVQLKRTEIKLTSEQAEARRVQAAIDALPSPTRFEASLYE